MSHHVGTWGEDPEGQHAQLRACFDALQDRARCLRFERDRKDESIPLLIQESDACVETSTHNAYRSLGQAVDRLLRLQNGDTRLSRSHPAMVRMLSDAVSKFEILCQVCRQSAHDIGVNMGDMIALKDETTRFMRELKVRMDELNFLVPRVWDVIRRYEQQWKHYRDDEPSLRRAVRNAEDDRDDLGNSILAFFDPDVRDNLDKKLDTAKARLERNVMEQEQLESKYESFYRFAMVVRNNSAAVASLHDNLVEVAAYCRNHYHQLIYAQSQLNELMRGSLVLRNVLWDADLTISRDTALQVVNRFIDAHRDVNFAQSHRLRTLEYTVTQFTRRIGGHSSDSNPEVKSGVSEWILRL